MRAAGLPRPAPILTCGLCLLAHVIASSASPATPAAPLVGAWTAEGVPVCTAAGNQLGLVGVSDGAGGAIFAWEDHRDGPGAIFALRLTSSGTIAPGWVPNGSRVSTIQANQTAPSIASNGSGGAFIAWQDDRTGHPQVYVQHINPDGGLAPGWPQEGLAVAPDTARDEGGSHVVSDTQGGALVAWSTFTHYGTQPAIVIKRLTSAGQPAPGWSDGGTVVDMSTHDEYGSTSIASAFFAVPDLHGGAILAWNYSWSTCYTHCTSGANYAIRHISSTPTGAGFDFGAGRPAEEPEVEPRSSNPSYVVVQNYLDFADRDGTGGMMVLYTDDYYEPVSKVVRYNALGNGVWGKTAYAEAFSGDGAGGNFLAWRSQAAEVQILGLHVTANGSPVAGWSPDGNVLASSQGERFQPALAPDGLGGAFVTWFDTRSGGTHLYATRVGSDGTLGPGWAINGNPVCDVSGSRGAQLLIGDVTGSAIVAWQDHRGADVDIYAQRLTSGSPVPTVVSLVRAQSLPGVAELEWFAPAGTMPQAVVQRREPSSVWVALASIVQDGGGHLAFTDRMVASGRRYGYRLGIGSEGGSTFTDEVWIDIPSGFALAVHGFRPNPAVGHVTVAFTLPDAGPARLELFDLSGRRVAVRKLEHPTPGSQELDLGPGGHIAAGTYWVRLSQAGRSVSTRGDVVR